MPKPALAVAHLLSLLVLLRPLPGHALGFDEQPQPGELTPAAPAPERHRGGVGVTLSFPLGRARLQTSHSLGWRVGGVRWLGYGLGLALAMEHQVLAKSGDLPRAMDLTLQSAAAGMRYEWRCTSSHAAYAEARAVVQQKTISYRERKLTERALGASVAAGATARLAFRVYAVLRVSYVSAPHRMAALELGFERGF